MAKITAVILPNEKSNFDGSYNVKIRIGHKGKSVYIDSGATVSKKDISGDKIKPAWIIANLSEKIKEMTLKVSDLLHLEAKEIKERLLKEPTTVKVTQVDFLDFYDQHIQGIKRKGGIYGTFLTSYNALVAYMKGRKLLATDITSTFLRGFERYLCDTAKEGAKGTRAHVVMREMRTVFNAALYVYNDEDEGVIVIPNNPYKKYKLVKLKPTANRDLSIDQILKVFDAETVPNSNAERAKDLAMLSFYMCGMNATDMFRAEHTAGDRLNYNRAKTKDRRSDDAFISIKIIPEARALFDKYIGKLKNRYSTRNSLNQAMRYGMNALSETTAIPNLQFIKFRHSFASIARNECRIGKDDIAMAMNHVDNSNKVTDIYIRKDWSIIDDVQKSVVDTIEIARLLK